MKLLKLSALAIILSQPCILGAATTPGTFTQVPGSPFVDSGTTPEAIAFSPLASGNLFAAIANFNSSNVSVYLVDQSTGVFTQIAAGSGSPFATGVEPRAVAFSPIASGNLFAAVANSLSASVSVYLVNQISGLFTPVGTFAAASGPDGIAFSPIASGNLFAAVANNTGSSVTVYTVNQNTGVFSPASGSPVTVTTPTSIAFSPLIAGNLFAAVTHGGGLGEVSVYLVDQNTGAFTPVTGSPFITGGTGPNSVAFSPDAAGNLFVAVSNSGGGVSVFQVAPTTGVLTPVAGSPFATGATPEGVAFSPFVSGDLFAAVPNGTDNTVSVYQVNPTTGVFTQLSTSPYATGTDPFGIAFSPVASGNLFAAIPNRTSDNVSVYQVTIPSSSTFAGSVLLDAIFSKYC